MLQFPVPQNLHLISQRTKQPKWKVLLRSITLGNVLGNLTSEQDSQHAETKQWLGTEFWIPGSPRGTDSHQKSLLVVLCCHKANSNKVLGSTLEYPHRIPHLKKMVWEGATAQRNISSFSCPFVLLDWESTGLFWRSPAGWSQAGLSLGCPDHAVFFATGVSNTLGCSNLQGQRQL